MSEDNKRCWFAEHSMYVNRQRRGFMLAPCCLTIQHQSEQYVESIDQIFDSKFLCDVRDKLKKNIEIKECTECWGKEKSIGYSIRTTNFSRLKNAKGKEIWDLRPGNTCNLKCIMCGPHLSSAWYQDIDIHKKHVNMEFSVDSVNFFLKTDWEYIQQHTPNVAKKIYIAGGEPFYMKEVKKFISHISKYEWNLKNTVIAISTNGISFDNDLLENLSKFKKINLIMSIDGYGKVNEYIRYPSNFDMFLKNFSYLDPICDDLSFAITVQACNLPNLDYMKEQLELLYPEKSKEHYDYNLLRQPEFLNISSLKPKVIEQVYAQTKIKVLKGFIEDNYNFNENNNVKLKNYLTDIDIKRNLNSKKILPWCWK